MVESISQICWESFDLAEVLLQNGIRGMVCPYVAASRISRPLAAFLFPPKTAISAVFLFREHDAKLSKRMELQLSSWRFRQAAMRQKDSGVYTRIVLWEQCMLGSSAGAEERKSTPSLGLVGGLDGPCLAAKSNQSPRRT